MLTVTEPDEARQLALKAMATAGVDANNPEGVRELRLQALLEAQRKLSPAQRAAFGMAPTSSALFAGWGPLVDGAAVTRHLFGKDAATTADNIPMMIGYASHDPSPLMAGSPNFPRMGTEQARSRAAADFPDAGAATMERFRSGNPNHTGIPLWESHDRSKSSS